jgi:Divergent InlB B-repeat domain
MKLTYMGALPAAILAFVLALPGFGQYYSNDLTPAGTTSGKLLGTKSGKQVGGGGSSSHAVLMTGNALSYVDLHPASGYYNSMATSTDDSEQCGYSQSMSTATIHASKWSGSSASHVDLHPSGFNFSYCMGVDGGDESGFAEQQSYATTISHAYLWHGSSSGVDLHPTGMHTFSRSLGTKGGEQVGYGSSLAYPVGDTLGYHSTSKALRWRGTAASVVSLHPAGFDASEALATNGVQQGGWGYVGADPSTRLHALLWTGTAESAVDLHPAGYVDSKITAMTETLQVGEAWVGVTGAVGSVRHALVWTGTAASVVDLNQYLPAGYKHAVATGVDANGNVVGFAYNTYYQGLTTSPDAIAVVFAPGQAPATSLSAISLSSTNAAPGDSVTATVTLGGPAPSGGVNLNFLSTNQAVMATPANTAIAAGASSATITIPVLGATMTTPATLKLYASDGVVSKVASLTVTPVVKLSTLNINAVEGGFSTTGTVALNIPAQLGGAAVTLSSSNTALLQVPATLNVPNGVTSLSFVAATSAVTAATSVPVTASFNGTTATANVSLNAAPVVAVSTITANNAIGGQTITGTVTLTNFVRATGGATITLSSGDTNSLQVPAPIVIPQGQWSASFTATTSVVNGQKGVSLRAGYNGSQATTTVTLSPIPPITIVSAVYKPDVQMLKIDVTTPDLTSILTFGSNGVPFGTMQFEAGIFQGSMVMATAPATITVWSSVGGEASMPVTISVPGGGGTGGGTSSPGFKVKANRNGKGTITSNPAGISCMTAGGVCTFNFASGTSVTLTATPDAGQPWKGWADACSGLVQTCTLTITKDTIATANFK